MKPSEQVKALGFNSLKEVAEAAQENEANFFRWPETKPRRFELILKGLMFEKMASSIEVAFSDLSESKRDA